MGITGADGDETKLIQAGAFGHMLKPFLEEEGEASVARALDRRE